jgi:hypothetical protein
VEVIGIDVPIEERVTGSDIVPVREEHKRRVFENRVLRRMFGPKEG